jgi:hypothetical protein
MGYIEKGDSMANSYSVSWRTWKWTMKLFFHLFNLTILNDYIILTSCGSQISSDFSSKFVENESKWASTSVQPKRKIKLQTNPMTSWSCSMFSE